MSNKLETIKIRYKKEEKQKSQYLFTQFDPN